MTRKFVVIQSIRLISQHSIVFIYLSELRSITFLIFKKNDRVLKSFFIDFTQIVSNNTKEFISI